MAGTETRHIDFDTVLNFRDLGGYRTHDGRLTAWRRIYRSGELHHMTARDIVRLREEISVRSVIDLRSLKRLDQTGVGPIHEVGAKYFRVPFSIVDGDDNKARELFQFTNSGEVYMSLLTQEEYGRRIVQALEIIAGPDNFPLVFHCNAGKDRSGILSAMLLSVLDVIDEDIIEDYTLTAPYMADFIRRWDDDPVTAHVHSELPPFQLEAAPESMTFFLTSLRKEYGSAREYLEKLGADRSLCINLRKVLLA
jgi:protein-tyrosine phosphatase